jgi:serine/threonine-protein kinase RsbW
MKSLKIQIPSLMENIRMIESFIDNAKDKHEINEDIYGNIMIAVTESVNNAIKHGNQENEKKNVNLTMELDDTLIRFLIEDEGEGFNPDTLADPTAPENLDKPGGRGIFLMKHLSDEVKFAENGRIVELVFYVA